MKALKVVKFQIVDTLKSILIYYLIILTIFMIVGVTVNNKGSVSSSGIETATMIFLFVGGLNSFKNNFYFSQANNLSRITFFKGLILSVFPIAFFMSVIDIIVNRIYNIYVTSPMNFDMIYTSLRDTGLRDRFSSSFVWVQNNDLTTLFQTLIWLFTAYCTFFIVGLFITLVYYQSNKLLKIIISVAPPVLIVASFNLMPQFWQKIGVFISNAFGWESRNPYMGVLSFTVISVILIMFIFLLVRKAVVKRGN